MWRAVRVRLTAPRFALEHEFDRTYISGIERGTRNPTITVVERLADALEVPIGRLLGDPDPDEGTS